jgi:aspartyl-tRNA(Asn)/glutamyl-tRNA(Gln) amidotransferase subunit A
MTLDLSAAREQVLSGKRSAASAMEESIAACAAPANALALIRTNFAQARAVAHAVDAARACGAPLPPLAGLAVSVKDLFDVHGEITTAGSIVLVDAAPAAADCPAVARLRRAGAAFIGRSNMSEFAFSGVGINPHHGTPANAATLSVDSTPRIPGGSTSGGAVSVASGAAWAALGSDTGGSLRVPAALQGLVGFKNTARLTPTQGAIPLSTTLDTVGAITRSVRDAALLHSILADEPLALRAVQLQALRLAMPRGFLLDELDAGVAKAFERSLATLRRAGARIDEIDLAPLGEVASIMSGGGFAPAEAWAWHRERIVRDEARYDPRVALRIRRGESMGAAEYIELIARRKAWIAAMQTQLRDYDAMLSPTVPMVAPPIAPLLADDAAFFAINAKLLRNPSMVNLLDGCAISLPCHAQGEMPVGLMLWSGALCDQVVLNAALAVETALARQTRSG